MSERPKPGSDEEIQWFGANARARGEPSFSNPYEQPPTLPGDIAVPESERRRLGVLWKLGWSIEDAMRG